MTGAIKLKELGGMIMYVVGLLSLFGMVIAGTVYRSLNSDRELEEGFRFVPIQQPLNRRATSENP